MQNKHPFSRFTFLTLLGSLFTASFSANAAPEPKVKAGEYHGQVSQINQTTQAWHEQDKTWFSIDDFWQNWASKRDHKNWPSSKQYPVYEQVKEQETFLVKLESGTCMMEFWHGRWRRANDVRRWDEKFNDYSACPYVFD